MLTFEKSSCQSKLTCDVTTDLLAEVTVKLAVEKASSIMSWVTTSMLNGRTKWHGPGKCEYDEAAAIIGAEVRDAFGTRAGRLAVVVWAAIARFVEMMTA